MTILAIDTSCDDTSVAVCQGQRVLSSVVSSQVRYHKKYGGVVPFLAQRLHRERISSVMELALKRAEVTMAEIEAVAVTYGPGLAPALGVGVETARQLATEHSLPLYPINHMAGHIAACLAATGSRKPAQPELPALALLVSGNHTELVLMPRFGDFTVIGQTLDDALGEAYDKVGRMLGLGYPAGRTVSKLAEEGDSTAYPLPIPMQRSGTLDMSYSGLKNAVRLLVEAERGEEGLLTRQQICDICACFELVAHKAVLIKLEMALRQHPEVRSLLLGGGVSSNAALRRKVRSVCRPLGVTVYAPPNQKLCTDNAAMIGVAAYLGIQAGAQPVAPELVDRKPGLAL